MMATQIHILSPLEDDSESINRCLRDAAVIAHCHWHRAADSLYAALDARADLIVVRSDPAFGKPEDVVASLRNKHHPQPVIALVDTVDETTLTQLQTVGVADGVTLAATDRMRVTMAREIRLMQMSRQIADSRDSAMNIQRQFTTLMDNVPDAIAHVQEGIIVETNKAWLELFGIRDGDGIATPFMDAIAPASQAAVKGALVAISKDKWNNESLEVDAVREDGKAVPLTLTLEGAVFDDEPAVRVAIKPAEKEDKRREVPLRHGPRLFGEFTTAVPLFDVLA
ncbi:MAG: PAS domain-containing protein, partial [Pseudomonadota bacterium]